MKNDRELRAVLYDLLNEVVDAVVVACLPLGVAVVGAAGLVLPPGRVEINMADRAHHRQTSLQRRCGL